jgi:hypothetical protein
MAKTSFVASHREPGTAGTLIEYGNVAGILFGGQTALFD